MNRDIRILQNNTLPAEVVVLLLIGLVMLILGVLLFPIYAGLLPYYEDGLFSLLIIVAALQILALGKTPFGDVQRNLPTILFGIVIAAGGIVICFIPDILGDIPRLLLIVFFVFGGAVQLLQLYRRRETERIQKTADPLLGKLTMASAFVYFFSGIIGITLIFQSETAGILTCAAVLGYGIVITTLALILVQVYRKYPPAEPEGSVSLSIGNVMILLTGIFMVLLGILLIPVNLGLLPFSPSAQLGLLLIIFAIQMMLLGETPVGSFSRTHLIVGLGFLLAAIGVICCIIPEVLLIPATIIIAAGNIGGGVLGLTRLTGMLKTAPSAAEGPVAPLSRRIPVLMGVMNVLAIVFGTSMLLPTLLPGILVGIVLAANGFVLLSLLYLLKKIERLSESAA